MPTAKQQLLEMIEDYGWDSVLWELVQIMREQAHFWGDRKNKETQNLLKSMSADLSKIVERAKKL